VATNIERPLLRRRRDVGLGPIRLLARLAPRGSEFVVVTERVVGVLMHLACGAEVPRFEHFLAEASFARQLRVWAAAEVRGAIGELPQSVASSRSTAPDYSRSMASTVSLRRHPKAHLQLDGPASQSRLAVAPRKWA
jgi:hypothetical protein